MKKRLGMLLILCIVVGMSMVTMAAAKPYPSKSIDYVIPFDAGGESDLTARLQQRPLEEIFGQKVLIKNKPGGGGALGWSELAKSKPDGYIIGGINLPHTIVQPLQNKNSGYKTLDLVPVYYFQSTPNVLVVAKNSKFNTLDDLIQFAKANPEVVTLGGSGSNSANHLGVLELNKAAGIKCTYIPFTGSGTATPALLGGHVMGLMTYTTMAINYKNDFKVLAVATEKRIKSMPDVPTFRELGYDIVEGAYRGVGVSVGTPVEVMKKIEEAFAKVNKDPEFIAKMVEMGFEIEDYGIEASKKLVESKLAYYTELLTELGMVQK